MLHWNRFIVITGLCNCQDVWLSQNNIQILWESIGRQLWELLNMTKYIRHDCKLLQKSYTLTKLIVTCLCHSLYSKVFNENQHTFIFAETIMKLMFLIFYVFLLSLNSVFFRCECKKKSFYSVLESAINFKICKQNLTTLF